MNSVDLTNTPGYYYAAAYWIAAMRLIILFRNSGEKEWILQKNSRKEWAAHTFFLLFLTFFMEITKNSPIYLFLFFVAAEFFLLLLFLKKSLSIPFRNAVLYASEAFVMGEFTASFTWQMFYYFVMRGWLQYSKTVEILFMVPFYCLLLLAARFTDRYLFRRRFYVFPLEKEEVTMAVIILVFTYVFSNLSYAFQGTPFSTTHLKELFIIRTLADLMGIGLLSAYAFLLENTRSRIEVEMLQKTLQMQYDNYKIAEESVDLINRKYHDLKHQIGILKEGLEQKEQSRKYLEQVESEISDYEAQNKTGNRVLDTILTSKALLCRKNEIRLTVMADGTALGFMDPMDLSSLFGNILDNAIEGVMELEDPEQRLIRLQVSRRKGFLHVVEENRCIRELRFLNGDPVTTKQDTAYHGFGVKSIRATAAKYGGTTNLTAKEGWFRVSILFPPEVFEKE